MICPSCERLTKERDEARALANAEFAQIQRDLAQGMAANEAGREENAKLRAEVESKKAYIEELRKNQVILGNEYGAVSDRMKLAELQNHDLKRALTEIVIRMKPYNHHLDSELQAFIERGAKLLNDIAEKPKGASEPRCCVVCELEKPMNVSLLCSGCYEIMVAGVKKRVDGP